MLKENFWSALIVGICIGIAGMSIGIGFYKGRSNDRYVTVKGLAEREVNADLAIWPITFKVTENDLRIVQKGIDKGREVINRFLTEAGFKEEEISYSAPKITDMEAERRYGNEVMSQYRYIAQTTVTVRSRNVDLTSKTIEQSGKLVGEGIVLAAENWQAPTEFLFTSLNAIKPEMIEEATKDARKAAEKFAKDSGSKVGKIRNATQGYFSIEDRDRNSPQVKKIRVVTSVQYFLVD
jgi:hypothetical protein